MGVITFNGKTSEDYGFVVEHPPAYKMPQQDVTATHVPGRNGDVLYFRDSYQNVTRSYEIAFAVPEDGSYATYEKFVRHAMEWLNQTGSNHGYQRLYDTYDPDIFRMAYYAGGLDLNNIYNQGGRGTINFVCKPQKFLNSGLDVIKIEGHNIGVSSDDITIPTAFPANPLYKITIDHSILSGNSAGIGIRYNDEVYSSIYIECEDDMTLYIDIEKKDAYSIENELYVNRNSIVSIDSFTSLPGFTTAGDTIQFVAAGIIPYAEVIPRWWTL